jgi:hypothetical protein
MQLKDDRLHKPTQLIPIELDLEDRYEEYEQLQNKY